MDQIKTGRFLAELRRSSGLTQEQLGEKLGVTNKTVSRWETGTYMPPVECLELLSEIFSVSINEIVAGERLTEEHFKQKAEENLRDTLEQSAFSYKERLDYFEKKWLKDHLFELIFAALLIAVLTALVIRFMPALYGLVSAIAVLYAVISRNRKRAYAELKAFNVKERLKD